MEKLCVFCKHFDWDKPYDAGSGCPTCGGSDIEGGFTCKKKHYSELLPYDEDGVREVLLTAETCPDYSPPSQEK